MKNFEINSKVLKEIAQFFEIGPLISANKIEQGMNNFSYSLTNTKDDEFVLRILGKQTIDGVKNEYFIEKQLQDHRISAPFMLRNKASEYIYRHGNITATISKKIPGKHPKIITESLCILVGKTLAEFHQSITNTKLPTNHVGWMNISSAESNLNYLKKDNRLDALSNLINNSAFIFNQNLPQGIIHGDFIGENMLLSDHDNSIAILDFDESEDNILLLDVVKTITGFCVTEKGQIDNQLIRAFLKGYQQVRVITEEEKKHFLNTFLYVVGCCSAWFIVNSFEKSAERYLKFRENMNFYDYF